MSLSKVIDRSFVNTNSSKIISTSTSVMPASTTFTITYDDDFGFEDVTSIFFEFVSDNSISLVTNVGGDIITTQSGHTLVEVDIILDELVLTNDLSITFDNDIGFIVKNRF